MPIGSSPCAAASGSGPFPRPSWSIGASAPSAAGRWPSCWPTAAWWLPNRFPCRTEIVIESDAFGGRAIRWNVAGVVFHGSADPQSDDLWPIGSYGAAGTFDRLLLFNGDELSGRLVGVAEGWSTSRPNWGL